MFTAEFYYLQIHLNMHCQYSLQNIKLINAFLGHVS